MDRIRTEVGGDVLAAAGGDRARARSARFLGRSRQVAANAVEQVESFAGRARRLVEREAERGRSPTQIAASVRQLYLDSGPTASRLIAQSGVIPAINDAVTTAVADLTRADVVTIDLWQQWVTMGDDRVRKSHADAAGQTVRTGEQFSVGNARLSYPGDPTGPIEEVANCRCTTRVLRRANEDLNAGGGDDAVLDPATQVQAPTLTGTIDDAATLPVEVVQPATTVVRQPVVTARPDVTDPLGFSRDVVMDAAGRPSGRSGSVGNARSHRIFEQQGYTGRAELVDADELDELIASGHRELHRGLAGDDVAAHVEQFKSGELFVGDGTFGSGIYTTPSADVASGYAGGSGRTVRMALRPDARVVDHSEIDELRTALRRQMRRADDLDDDQFDALKTLAGDDGVLAAMNGIDAYTVGAGDDAYVVVVNRTALVVER